MNRHLYRTLAWAALVPLLATMGLAQETAPPPAPTAGGSGGAAYLPLGVDARWRWRISNPAAGRTLESSTLALREVPVDGGACWELRQRQGSGASWIYQAARPDGLYLYRNAYLGGWRGVNRQLPPRRILACPPQVGFVWEWAEEGSVQTADGAESPPPEDLRIHFRAAIEAVDQDIAVPAGTYPAVRVKITRSSRIGGDGAETLWFAKGVGLVKKIESAGSDSPLITELLSFTPPSRREIAAPSAALDAWLAAHAACPKGHVPSATTWLEHPVLAAWFRSRFCRLACEDGATLRRVHLGVVTDFDPRSKNDWTALLEDEHLSIGDDLRGDSDQAVGEIARACALLAGLLRDPAFRPADPGESVTSTLDPRDGHSWTVEVQTSATVGDGRKVRVDCSMAFRAAKVINVQIAFRE